MALAGSAFSSFAIVTNSTISSRRSPPSNLATNDCGLGEGCRVSMANQKTSSADEKRAMERRIILKGSREPWRERGIWISSGAALFLLPGSDNQGAASPMSKLTIERQRVDALTPYRV